MGGDQTATALDTYDRRYLDTWSVAVPKRAGTNVKPWESTSAIINVGPYRFSRNPIYLAGVIVGLGVGIASDNLWGLSVMIPFAALIQYKVITKEERYLESKFGEEYVSYKKQVRRWL